MKTIEKEIRNLIKESENCELEFKSAKGGFPESFWETFSAFANTNGGIIVLGIKHKDKKYIPDNLTEEQINIYKKRFWDQSVLSLSPVCPQSVLSLSSVCPQSVLSLSKVCSKSNVTNENIIGIVLTSLISEELSISSLMVKTGEKNKNRFRQNILNPLIEANLIEPTIKDKPNSSKQAYRLTEKAKELINS